MLRETDWDIRIKFKRKTLKRDLNSINIVRMNKWISKRRIMIMMRKLIVSNKLDKIMMVMKNKINMISNKIKDLMKIEVISKVIISNTWTLHNKSMSVKGMSHNRISGFMTVVEGHHLQVIKKELLITVRI